MTDAAAGTKGHRPHNYVVIDNMLYHRRWINPDGTHKTGRALNDERARVALEQAARLLLEAGK